MPAVSTPTMAEAIDPVRAAELRRIKALALAVLVACLCLLVVAKILEPRHPAFGFVAAFAEAATIGGLADWYAVVALFRRPLGLPIPHTAIIPNNQGRIAEKLGAFIEQHFLAPVPIEKKLREIDFATFVSAWMSDRKRSADLARFILRLLPDGLAAIESSGIKTFVTRRLAAQIDALDITPLVIGTLTGFVREGRHRALLDELMNAVHGTLNEPATLEAVREKIRSELPTLLNLYRADAFLMKKVVAAVSSFFQELRNDPEHPFRGELDRLLLSLVDKMAADPAHIARLESLKKDMLSRPEVADAAQRFWTAIRTFLEKNASGETNVLHHHLTNGLVAFGHHLAADSEMRGEINEGVVTVLRSFIEDQKSGVSRFIADQVKSWDMGQLVSLLEVNVGRDLQFIRFNGTLIGGLAGLSLHTIEVVLKSL